MLSHGAVREALACMYDAAALDRSSMAEELRRALGDGEQVTAQHMRQMLLDAIQMLRPTGKSAPSASAYRAYECINLRYVSGVPVEEIADELSIGPRQVYRDLRWGENRLLEILSAQLETAVHPSADDPLLKEAQVAANHPGRVQLAETVVAILEALQPLADRFACQVTYLGPSDGVAVRATPGVLRESLAQLFSAVLQNSAQGEVTVSLRAEGGEAVLTIPLPMGDRLPKPGLLEAAIRVAQTQCELSREGSGESEWLCLRLPLAGRRRVLVVEDNLAAAELYARYLAGTDWEPLLCGHPASCGSLAIAMRADAVILDLMMPQTDGWSVLQALRINQQTRHIPVLICSVVDDPELGKALGASYYLTKPVTRMALLGALSQLPQPDS